MKGNMDVKKDEKIVDYKPNNADNENSEGDENVSSSPVPKNAENCQAINSTPLNAIQVSATLADFEFMLEGEN